MLNNTNDKNIVFLITEKQLQEEAKRRIGRKLSEDELYSAKKGIEAGLSFDIDTVFQTAIEEAIDQNP